ncbi:hypothetical protein niasHT_024886 [Heterodera trifolii]|uniref:Uncharacterized protein n=1 Tax=Heterodera trifolii TaxID=157864 RepID=A0ABD2JYW1_9BILA
MEQQNFRANSRIASTNVKGRIWTDLNNHFIRLAKPHTCPANASNVEAQKVKTTIKIRSITTFELPSVIRSELQNVPSPAAIGDKKGCELLNQRAHYEINAPPAVPTNLNFEIGQAYRTYTSTDGVEELFLLGDSGVYFENGNENPQRNLQKKVKQQGLWQRYYADPVFALNVRMLTSVAFVPLCDIRNAVTALDTEFGNLVAFRPLIDSLLDKYVGRPRPHGTWSQPLFRPDQWNVYQRTLDGDSRTNNNAEAEPYRLQDAFSCRHPSLWNFIDVIRREQKIANQKYNSAIAGLSPEKKRGKYLAADRRILNMVRNYSVECSE